MSNKLTRLARQILSVEDDLTFRLDLRRDPNTRIDDFEFYVFEQTWASTALGFNGMGGQSITSDYTIVCVPITTDQPCVVYFGGRFAYCAGWSEVLQQDLAAHEMMPVAKAGKYRNPKE